MPPLAIAGGIAAAGAVGSAAISSSATKKASKAASADAARQEALQREVYGQNKAALSPYMARGNAAGDTINALLGLGAPAAPQPSAFAAYGTAPQYMYVDGIGNVPLNTGWNGAPQAPYTLSYSGQPTAAAPDAKASALAAYDIFKNSTGYQSRFNEGMRAINSGLAGRGTLQSGAAIRSALRYGQDYASNEFGNYLGYLGNQQGVGLSGASALAGVGQNYANAMGAIGANNANMQAQAAIANARTTGNAITGVAGALGNVFGSSYSGLVPGVDRMIASSPGIF